jgi:hypothetical protein
MTGLKALASFFNAKGAPNYKPLREFAEELKSLSHAEKEELGALAAAAMGEPFTPTPAK